MTVLKEFYIIVNLHTERGWSGMAKVLCILRHWDVKLVLAYRWARSAIFMAVKGRKGIFFISSVSSLSFHGGGDIVWRYNFG